MNISTLLLSLLLFCLSSFGQETKIDSARYYRKELQKLQIAYEDSFRNSTRTKELSEKLKYAQWASDNYAGISIFTQIGSANYDVLNADNSVDGFGPISGPMISVGIGFTIKQRRIIYDFEGSIGLNKKTTKENETIKTSVSPIQLSYGYDLIKNRNISLYPYAGLSMRIISLEYKTTAQLNPSPNSIASLVQNNTSVKDRENEFGYQAGVGFEYMFPSKGKLGVVLFAKVGTNRAFSKKSMNMEGHPYSPNMQYGNWTITAGIKLVGR